MNLMYFTTISGFFEFSFRERSPKTVDRTHQRRGKHTNRESTLKLAYRKRVRRSKEIKSEKVQSKISLYKMKLVACYRDIDIYENDFKLFNERQWLSDSCISYCFKRIEDSLPPSISSNIVFLDPSVTSFIRLQCQEEEEFSDLRNGLDLLSKQWYVTCITVFIYILHITHIYSTYYSYIHYLIHSIYTCIYVYTGLSQLLMIMNRFNHIHHIGVVYYVIYQLVIYGIMTHIKIKTLNQHKI